MISMMKKGKGIELETHWCNSHRRELAIHRLAGQSSCKRADVPRLNCLRSGRATIRTVGRIMTLGATGLMMHVPSLADSLRPPARRAAIGDRRQVMYMWQDQLGLRAAAKHPKAVHPASIPEKFLAQADR